MFQFCKASAVYLHVPLLGTTEWGTFITTLERHKGESLCSDELRCLRKMSVHQHDPLRKGGSVRRRQMGSTNTRSDRPLKKQRASSSPKYRPARG